MVLQQRDRSTSFDDIIRERSSVRSFETAPVPVELVRKAIEAAGWAPSPHGTQPWRFAVVESAERRQHLADTMGATWEEQLRLDGQDEAVVQRRLARSKERLERAPVVVVLCLYLDDLEEYPDAERQGAERLMAIQSLGAAAQNFLLAIHRYGLDAGWMCAPLFCPDVVRDALNLSEDVIPHAMFPVGLAAAPPKRRDRRPVAELIVSWD